MMERKLYQLTEKQIEKAAGYVAFPMPNDEEFKAMWKKAHHGKVVGWGMGKAQWIVSNMKFNAEYIRGLWQGAVDKANGMDYSEERNENVYNLGYYRGYTEYESNRRGWDANTRQWFDATYVS
jgi:hypothetical protein